MRSKWRPLLFVGLILLMTSLVIGCTESNTKEDLDAAYDEGYSKGYAAGKAQGYDEGLSEGESTNKEAVDASYDRGYKVGYEDGSGIAIEEDYQQYFIQGNGYLAQEKWDEAIAKYTMAIEINPEYIDAYVKRATAYNEKDDYYELAILDCEKAVALDPTVKIGPLLARAYFKRGEYNAQFVKANYYSSDDYQENENTYRSAYADFTRAIELNPKLIEAYVGRANINVLFNEDRDDYIMTVGYDTTIADYTMAITYDPTNAIYYIGRARAYSLGENYERELADETKAIELDPTNASYYRSRGSTYSYGFKNYTKAIQDYTKAIEFGMEDDSIYFLRGGAFANEGSLDLAIADYTLALAITDATGWSLSYYYERRGDVYAEKGDYIKAIEDYTQAIEINNFEGFFKPRALAYLKQENYELAIADSSKAIELYIKDDEAYWIRGRAYAALGQKNEALADFMECIALSEDSEKYSSRTRERNNLVRQEIEKLQ